GGLQRQALCQAAGRIHIANGGDLSGRGLAASRARRGSSHSSLTSRSPQDSRRAIVQTAPKPEVPMTKVLVDINVVLDVLLDRRPHATASVAVWAAIEAGRAQGLL